MNFAAPSPWAAEAPPRQQNLADLAGAAVPFPGSVPWAPASSRKAPVNFLPAWQELQLQNQQLCQKHAADLPAANLQLPLQQPASFPAHQPQQSQRGQKSANNPPPQTFGLAFPGEMTDEKEKRRRQQQEMQQALAEQIKEQRARKQMNKMEKSDARAEEPADRWETSRSGPKLGPKHDMRQEPEQREVERRRQQQELQRVLAAQVEEARQRKEEARLRQKEEEDREEQRLRREIEEENQRELRKAERLEAKKAPRVREDEAREQDAIAATGRSTRTRERFRDEPWRESQSSRLRKTRDRLRETRHGRSRRPRTRDPRDPRDARECEASPSREIQSPVPSTAAGPADTAGTWVGTCSPPPRRKPMRDGRDSELGFQDGR